MIVIDLLGYSLCCSSWCLSQDSKYVQMCVYENVSLFLYNIFLIFSILRRKNSTFEHEAFQQLSKLIIICCRVNLLSTISNLYMRKITHVLRKHGILNSFSSGPLFLACSLASLPRMYICMCVC